MSIMSGMCVFAKRDFMRGVHRPEDTYKIALYGASAHLSPLTEFYQTAGEVTGQGYTKGGQVLHGYQCEVDGVSSCMGWDDVKWKNATINARGALVYNASKENRALVVIDFGKDVISTNGPWDCPMPALTSDTALLCIS